MLTPPLPPDEEARLQRLDELRTVHSPAEYRFDRITALARRVFDVPIALITLIAARHQWFKSAQGLAVDRTSREISFCGHAIVHPEVTVVRDALADPRFADNPLVLGEPFIRFYAGHPLSHQGSALGTLCVIDRRPREFSVEDEETLASLAAWVENELEVEALSEAQRQLLHERDELRRAALIDPLTQTWNDRARPELLERELALARRDERPVALLALRLERLDEIRDSCGRQTRDALLREAARRVRAGGRPQDFLAHDGDGGFLLFLGECSEEAAVQRARRILVRLAADPVPHDGGSLTLDASVGVATAVARAGLATGALVAVAEEALAQARAGGDDGLHHLRA